MQRLFPSVRRLLLENPAISATSILGTGPKGTVTKGDVLAALAAGPAGPAAGAEQSRAAQAAGPAPPRPASVPADHKAGSTTFADAQFTEEAPSNIRKARLSLKHFAFAYPNHWVSALDTSACISRLCAWWVVWLASGVPRATRETRCASELGKSFHVSFSSLSQIIAARLMESKLNSPHMYISRDIVLNEVLALRKHLAATGVKARLPSARLRPEAVVVVPRSERHTARLFWVPHSALVAFLI